MIITYAEILTFRLIMCLQVTPVWKRRQDENLLGLDTNLFLLASIFRPRCKFIRGTGRKMYLEFVILLVHTIISFSRREIARLDENFVVWTTICLLGQPHMFLLFWINFSCGVNFKRSKPNANLRSRWYLTEVRALGEKCANILFATMLSDVRGTQHFWRTFWKEACLLSLNDMIWRNCAECVRKIENIWK